MSPALRKAADNSPSTAERSPNMRGATSSIAGGDSVACSTCSMARRHRITVARGQLARPVAACTCAARATPWKASAAASAERRESKPPGLRAASGIARRASALTRSPHSALEPSGSQTRARVPGRSAGSDASTDSTTRVVPDSSSGGSATTPSSQAYSALPSAARSNAIRSRAASPRATPATSSAAATSALALEPRMLRATHAMPIASSASGNAAFTKRESESSEQQPEASSPAHSAAAHASPPLPPMPRALARSGPQARADNHRKMKGRRRGGCPRGGRRRQLPWRSAGRRAGDRLISRPACPA